MPTTISGNYAASPIAPDAGPGPESIIQVAVGNDGELATAAEQTALFQTIANHIAWLNRMKAKAATLAADWAKHIQAWRAANGHQRFAIDHLGFPAGQVRIVDADWRTSPISANANKYNAGTGTVLKDQLPTMPEWTWMSKATGSTGQTSLYYNNFGPAVFSLAGETAGDYNTLCTGNFGVFRNDNHVTFDCVAFGTGSSSRTVALGLAPVNGLTHFNAAANFIGFRVGASGDWECVCRASGAESALSSGVAATLPGAGWPERLRLEYHGAGVADDLVEAARFYINGVLKATITSNLPSGAIGMGLSDTRDTSEAAGTQWQVGRLRLRMSTAAVSTVI